jgi:hypothetical protein
LGDFLWVAAACPLKKDWIFPLLVAEADVRLCSLIGECCLKYR